MNQKYDSENVSNQNNAVKLLWDMPVTMMLIAVNIMVFLLCGITKTEVYRSGGINYEYITLNKEYARIISNIFLHESVTHLFNNMVGLYATGTIVERKLGSLNAAVIYFVSGIAGGIGSVYVYHMFDPGILHFSVGASGAVFGMICAAALVKFKSSEKMSPNYLLTVIGIVVLYSLISFTGNVNVFAHTIGAISGGIMAFLLTLGEWEYRESVKAYKIVGIIITAIMCIIGVFGAGIGKKANTIKDVRIDDVKNMYIDVYGIDKYNDVTYAQCLDRVCTDGRWEFFESTDDVEVVEFNGQVYYEDKNIYLRIQFIREEGEESFKLGFFGVNGDGRSSGYVCDFFEYMINDRMPTYE